MSDRISALMDGELDDGEASALLSAIKEHDELRRNWDTYHLVGDAIRKTSVLSADFTRKVSVKLADEPTVLAPHKAPPRRREMMAWYAAASFAAVAMVALAALKFSGTTEELDNLAVQTTPPSNSMVALQTNPNMNAYLVAHQEISPSATLNNYSNYTGKKQDMAR